MNKYGECKLNKDKDLMRIVNYRNDDDIDVHLPECHIIITHVSYDDFKKGNITNPCKPTVCGVGYIGLGPYKSRENGKITKEYEAWKNMLKRCYDSKLHEKYPTYIGCKVVEEGHNFQNFAAWYEDNYYEIEDQKICLDKDILIKGNKIYGPDTCVFVPQNINLLFVKSNAIRGDLPIGVYYDKQRRKYAARCKVNSQKRHIGYFDTLEEAFQAYKQFKENVIQSTADEYQYQIPEVLYDAMYNYRVEKDD